MGSCSHRISLCRPECIHVWRVYPADYARRRWRTDRRLKIRKADRRTNVRRCRWRLGADMEPAKVFDTKPRRGSPGGSSWPLGEFMSVTSQTRAELPEQRFNLVSSSQRPCASDVPVQAITHCELNAAPLLEPTGDARTKNLYATLALDMGTSPGQRRRARFVAPHFRTSQQRSASGRREYARPAVLAGTRRRAPGAWAVDSWSCTAGTGSRSARP